MVNMPVLAMVFELRRPAARRAMSANNDSCTIVVCFVVMMLLWGIAWRLASEFGLYALDQQKHDANAHILKERNPTWDDKTIHHHARMQTLLDTICPWRPFLSGCGHYQPLVHNVRW
jgi:hypothetical protein